MLRILLPFSYFITTRLKDGRSRLFHAAYEWVPGIALAYFCGVEQVLLTFLLSYLAFISIYELGYLMNDAISHRREGERQRHGPLSTKTLIVLVVVRLVVFAYLFAYLDFYHLSVLHLNSTLSEVMLMEVGYVMLAVTFILHNLLRSASIKCLTFIMLSYLRFMLPIAPWLTAALVFELTIPVLLNYSLFRLFIYMDSKNLLSGFDRRSPAFLISFYLLTTVFGVLLSFMSDSWIPAGLSLYYLVLAVGMSLALSMRRQ